MKENLILSLVVGALIYFYAVNNQSSLGCSTEVAPRDKGSVPAMSFTMKVKGKVLECVKTQSNNLSCNWDKYNNGDLK